MKLRTVDKKDLCPCGSHKKYKHCCRESGVHKIVIPNRGIITRTADAYFDDALFPFFDVPFDTEDFVEIDREIEKRGYQSWVRQFIHNEVKLDQTRVATTLANYTLVTVVKPRIRTRRFI